MVVYLFLKMIGLIRLLASLVKEMEVDDCFSFLGYYVALSYTRRLAFSSKPRDKLESRTSFNSIQLKPLRVALSTSNRKPDN